MNNNCVIRNATEKDYEYILRINEENVEVLSPMNAEKLHYFADVAEHIWIAELDGRPAAFMLTLREGVSDYGSENYRWFSQHYANFIYVDRIVVDGFARGQGVGRLLYEKLFEDAKKKKIPVVLAEIDTFPYNETSLGFHKEMGFSEVGTQTVRQGKVEVSLQERKIEEKII